MLIVGLPFFRPPQAHGGANVNRPEILHLIRRDLQSAIACEGDNRTLDVSPWLALSVLRKAGRTTDTGETVNGGVVIGEELNAAEFAGTCKSQPDDTVRAYVEAGIAPATRRAYKADLEHFRAWGWDIPTTDMQLAAYLAAQATSLKVATLTRRLAAISIAHKAQRLPSPVSSPLIRATMRGVRREHGTAQRQAAPLLREDLFVVLGAMGDRLKDLRDRALLLIGFAGGLRCSELVAIDLIDLARVREGIILTIRRSKTDQDRVGRKIGIPFGRTIHCPVRALDNWTTGARIEDGPVFRPVDRYGRVAGGRLSCEAVSLVVRDRMVGAGFDPTGYSGHSLRAGFATSATRAGVSTFKIRQQTGHASDAMLSRYVREGELFLGNAAGLLL
jgi:site-specific recombinase XerD